MLQQSNLIGYVKSFQPIGPQAEPTGVALTLETEHRERIEDAQGNASWVPRVVDVPVVVPGKRGTGLLKLESLKDARLFIGGGLRPGKTGLFVYADEAHLIGARPGTYNGRPDAAKMAEDIPF